MTRKNLFLLALLAVAFAAPLLAEEPAEKHTSLTLVGGPQYVNQDDLGRGKARFEEFREVPQGFAFEFGRFAWTPKDKGLLFSLTAIDAAQDDQRYFRIETGRRGESAFLQVADEGPGIAPEHRERLFERFYRVDKSRSREMGGTGLGLALVKWVAEAHGGRIELDTEVGRGSTFRILLPSRPSSTDH